MPTRHVKIKKKTLHYREHRKQLDLQIKRRQYFNVYTTGNFKIIIKQHKK